LAREICIKLALYSVYFLTRGAAVEKDGFATCSRGQRRGGAHQLKMIAERRETNLFKPNIKKRARADA
jgi:hypothetical protein